MMVEEFDIQEYMTRGVERVVSEALRVTLRDRKESAFMFRFARISTTASRKRTKAEKEGLHIPPCLIADITPSNKRSAKQLSVADWEKIFTEAEKAGISFMPLSGGEPLLRKDVIKAAADHDRILFPLFTDGRHFDEEYYELFNQYRNLVPIITVTNQIKGAASRSMAVLKEQGLVYGSKTDITKDNYLEFSSADFIGTLSQNDCKIIVYDHRTAALSEEEENRFLNEVTKRRKDHPEMVFVLFPDINESAKGCLAAGRGFFAIDPEGNARPCPFVSSLAVNVKETSLKEALASPLFKSLQEKEILESEPGVCCSLLKEK